MQVNLLTLDRHKQENFVTRLIISQNDTVQHNYLL